MRCPGARPGPAPRCHRRRFAIPRPFTCLTLQALQYLSPLMTNRYMSSTATATLPVHHNPSHPRPFLQTSASLVSTASKLRHTFSAACPTPPVAQTVISKTSAETLTITAGASSPFFTAQTSVNSSPSFGLGSFSAR